LLLQGFGLFLGLQSLLRLLHGAVVTSSHFQKFCLVFLFLALLTFTLSFLLLSLEGGKKVTCVFAGFIVEFLQFLKKFNRLLVFVLDAN